MLVTVHHIGYGQIIYEESFWTGKRVLTINGNLLLKQKKNLYIMYDESETVTCRLKGNFLTGVTLYIGEDTIELIPPSRWYEIACSVSIMAFILTWGNSPALCRIIPVVGGAVGGAIGGLAMSLNLVLMKRVPKIRFKLLIWLGMFLATFFACFFTAEVILAIFF